MLFRSTGGSVCFFLADIVSSKPMTPIGKIQSDIDALKDVKPGDVIAVYELTG